METSFANGGQLSVSHPEPWANPQAPMQILRWLGREDAPLKFRPRADLKQWSWALAFLRECLPHRAHQNTEAIASLAQYSIKELRALRAETGIQYEAEQRGILHLFFDEKEYAAAKPRAAQLRSFGMQVELCPPSRCRDIEPALATSHTPLAGGLFAPNDESGNAHLFCQRLTALCGQRGARLMFNTRIDGFNLKGGRIEAVRITREDGSADALTADAFVLCTGSHSPVLAREAGERLSIYPVKGYSVTLPAGPGAPQVSVTDESRRLVFSRLGDKLRIAGTAELNGFDLQINRARVDAILRRALELFPDAGNPEEATFWAGLRPATPSNRPCIGRGQIENFYLNTGHGTLGWTLSCGSARAIADIISKRQPGVKFPFFSH